MVAMSIGTTGKVTVGSVIKSLEVLFREGFGIGPGKLVVIPRKPTYAEVRWHTGL